MLIILWIGEVCKERNEGIQFWKVKGFEKISILPQSLLLPPLLLSLAYILLPFFYFSYENYFTKSLKHFPISLLLVKFCIPFEMIKCHSIMHDKNRPRDVMSDLGLVRALHLKCLSCVLMLDTGEENVAIE